MGYFWTEELSTSQEVLCCIEIFTVYLKYFLKQIITSIITLLNAVSTVNQTTVLYKS
jgi:hypothetical protein